MKKIVAPILAVLLRTGLFVGVVFCAAWSAGQGPQFSTTDPRFGPTTTVQQRRIPAAGPAVPQQVAPKDPAPVGEPAAPPATIGLTTGGTTTGELTAAEHPWGRFAPETWACMQTVTWNFQDGQQTVAVRDTKTTLESVKKDGVTLKQASTTNIGGRRIENAPTIHRFDFFQEPITENVTVKDGGAEKLVINHSNMVIPCKKRIYETVGATEKRKTVVWYSTQLYPYIFRVQSVLSRLPNETEPEERVLRRSTSEVLESSSFYPRLSKLGTYRIRTVKTDGSITTVIDTTCSRHIPGGIVHETTREFDGSNKEIRTVETKLINYHCAAVRQSGLEIEAEEPYYFDEFPRRPRWWRRWYAVPYY